MGQIISIGSKPIGVLSKSVETLKSLTTMENWMQSRGDQSIIKLLHLFFFFREEEKYSLGFPSSLWSSQYSLLAWSSSSSTTSSPSSSTTSSTSTSSSNVKPHQLSISLINLRL